MTQSFQNITFLSTNVTVKELSLQLVVKTKQTQVDTGVVIILLVVSGIHILEKENV